MIKFKIIFCLIFIIFIASVLADNINFNIAKENYNSFETFQSGINFEVELAKDLSVSNIKLLDNNGRNIDVSKKFIKLNSSYYFVYFDLPKINEGVYSFGVYDIFYNDKGISKKLSFFKNFNVLNNTDNLIRINPGFVFNKVYDYDENPFTLILKNNGENNVAVELKSDNNFLSFSSSKFILNKDSNNNINVNTILYNKEGSKFNGNIIVEYSGNKYIIPIFIERIFRQNENKINKSVDSVVVNRTIVKSAFLILGDVYGNNFLGNYTINSKGNEYFDVSIVNNGDISFTNVSISVDNSLRDIIFFDKKYFSYIPQYGIISLSLSVGNLSENYSGKFFLKSNEAKDFVLPVYVYKKIEDIKNETKIENKANESLIFEKKEEKKSFGFVWIIVAVIILLLLFLIYYIYKKNKPKEKDFNNFIDEIKGRR